MNRRGMPSMAMDFDDGLDSGAGTEGGQQDAQIHQGHGSVTVIVNVPDPLTVDASWAVAKEPSEVARAQVGVAVQVRVLGPSVDLVDLIDRVDLVDQGRGAGFRETRRIGDQVSLVVDVVERLAVVRPRPAIEGL